MESYFARLSMESHILRPLIEQNSPKTADGVTFSRTALGVTLPRTRHRVTISQSLNNAGFFLDFRKFPVRIIIVVCLSSTYTLSPNSAQGNGGPLKWGES
jgi:hypothetical protein